MTAARSFSEASIGGRPVGRPATNAAFQFAGDASRLTPEARRLIASKRWQDKNRHRRQAAPVSRSLQTTAELAALRGDVRRQRRFGDVPGAETTG